MPKVIEQIQHNNDVAALKSICCDALSNIGSHIFERLEVGDSSEKSSRFSLTLYNLSIRNKWP